MAFDDIAPFLSSRMLHLILMPTERCNFRCVYCYEDFAEGEMSRPVIEGVKALMARRVDGLDLLSLEWFGGEPMLAWPVVEEVQGYASSLCHGHVQAHLVGSMTTNGSRLSGARFARLLALGVRTYQITLDGAAEQHDRTRRRLGGGGSYAAIWRNLLAMHETVGEYQVYLRIHVTRDNQPSVRQLLGDLAQGLGGDQRFAVTFKAVRRFGGPGDATLPVLTRQEEPGVLAALKAHAEVLGLTGQQDIFSRPGTLQGCYAAALGSYVVRSTGDLAKCTVALRHPNNRVGRLRRDGTVEVDPAKMEGWMRGALRGEMQSLECPMRGWADNRRGTGGGDGLVQLSRSRSFL